VFVPRPDAVAEDDGWLLSYVHDATRDASELVVLDARDLSEPPLARVALPQRVPYGFHGDFVPDTDVAAGR
jgi:carotenoid cleavage dioxygenase